ncbi:MAG: phosphatidate cytidylyltransferase [Prevotellaceae bacterium]|jgi:phosphatidate cytidylyltransferase|nr:phosphatidate cytidylyltransferase [Prevotellaceae bacterium]
MKNLLTRTVSGIVFIGIMAGCLLNGAIPYTFLMVLLMTGMLLEFYTLTLGKGKWLQKINGMTLGIALWCMMFLPSCMPAAPTLPVVLAAMTLLLAGLFIQQLYRKDEKTFATVAYVLLGLIYIALPLSVINVAFLHDVSGKLLLSLFIILWSNDVGAYVFGMLFGQDGKHKLAPSISPKKSWEGFAGGVLAALGAGCLLSSLGWVTYGLPHTLVIALLIAVFGVFGDLVESKLKRSVEVKDSGKLIPGHGGLLDRFDAALMALPVACLYIFIVHVLLN